MRQGGCDAFIFHGRVDRLWLSFDRKGILQVKHFSRTESFDEWISRMGGEVLSVTNQFELHRFKAHGQSLVIYKNLKGKLAFSSDLARSFHNAFSRGEDLKIKKSSGDYRRGHPVRMSLMDRDGDRCFYCDGVFGENFKPTIEHLVPRIHGGPDHISNKFLACEDCNTEAGRKSAPEKIRMRELKRSFRTVQESFAPNAVMGFSP